MSPQEALKHYFKIEQFRHNQADIVDAILAGDDVMVVMPTGGGKSLCYQLPALILPGVTLVVSPLISLMKDQVDSLADLDIPATYINSSLSAQEMELRMAQILKKEFKIVYVAPERFKSQWFLQVLKSVGVSFFAIDEAHCISQWGHDFRPDYVKLSEAINFLGRPIVGTFTATATPDVQADIIKNAGLRDPKIFVSGFKRPNLELRVAHASKDSEKYAHLSKLIEQEKTGIIYCATRKRVEKVADILKMWDCSFVAYHAGLSDGEREEAQNKFMYGEVDIAVATNAFGMGIDRSNIRFVAHMEMPGTIEAYYQEVGRAGRDGKHSVCELYFGFADKRVQEFFIEGSNPSKAFIEKVYLQLVRDADFHNEIKMSIEDLAERIGKGTNSMAVTTSLSHLARANIIDRFDIPGQRIRGTRLLDPDLSPKNLPLDFQFLKAKEDRDFSKLDSVIKFSNSLGCRQEWILRHFGESSTEPCLLCDQCKLDTPAAKRPLTEDELIILKKALSGVARMSYKNSNGTWKARFGKGKIMQMLAGSKSQWIVDSSIQSLSTYGILKDLSKNFLDDLFKELERSGLLEADTSDSKFPLITLSQLGNDVMLGRQSICLHWPTSNSALAYCPPKEVKKQSLDSCVDAKLYELLRQTRSDIAKATRNARLFTILSNKTLEHLAALKPLTIEDAAKVPGIGPAKSKSIVPKFLETIENYLNSQNLEISA